jgi:hypothetical protein
MRTIESNPDMCAQPQAFARQDRRKKAVVSNPGSGIQLEFAALPGQLDHG